MDKLSQNQSREKAIKEAKIYIANYWTPKDETAEYFLLKKNGESATIHFIIAVFFGWWMFFIPNIIYHLLMIKKKKIYKYL